MKTKTKTKSKSKSKIKNKGKGKGRTKIKAKAKSKSATKTSYHLRENVTEAELITPLNEDLGDAWEKLRAFGESLNPKKIYASHNSIMFSKKVCCFFVRPRKSFLEVWMFMPREVDGLKCMRGAKTKVKYCNMFKLIHPDQVEEPLTDWIRESFEFTPDA